MKTCAALLATLAALTAPAAASADAVRVYGKVTRYFDRQLERNLSFYSVKRCGPRVCRVYTRWYSIEGQLVEACGVKRQRVACKIRRFIPPEEIERDDYVPPESVDEWDADQDEPTEVWGDEPATLNGEPVG
jgi:hypothetical protein